MSNGADSKGRGLDLGLGALLSSSDSTPPLSPSVAPPAETSPPQPLSISPFDDAVLREDWNEVLRLSEMRSHDQALSHDQRIEAELYWVLAQFKSGGMPRAILAAPLEHALNELSKASLEEPRRVALSALAAGICRDLARALESAGEGALHQRLLQSAAQFDPRAKEDLHKLAKGELENLERDPLLAVDAARQARHTALSEIASLHTGDSSASSGTTATSQTDGDPPTAGRSLRSLLLLVGLVLLIGGGITLAALELHNGALLRFFSELLSPAPDGEAGEVTVNSSAPALAAPGSERLSRTSDLDTLYYEMQSAPGSTATTASSSSSLGETASSAGTAAAPPVPAQVLDPTAAPAASPDASSRQSALLPRESINTAGPVEDADFRERLRRSAEHDEIARRKREGESGPRDRPQLFPDPHPKERRTETRLPERGKQGEATRYQVLTKTTVLSQPRYDAIRLTELEPGDEIEVDAVLGDWVRIISRNRVHGFVLRQDVQPFASR